MKKIIGGKLYNTETARLVGEWSNGCSGFSWCEEDLYVKKNGEYFLHGAGGPMSKYIRSSGSNSWCGKNEIIPFTKEKAMEWAEEHLTADEYISEFGEVEE